MRGLPTRHSCPLHAGLCLELGLFGIVRVYNPNSWITTPMTRIVGKTLQTSTVGKIKKDTRSLRPRSTGALCAPAVEFFYVFAYFANNPSHWDGNPGIGIVNPYNPKQSQLRQKPEPNVSAFRRPSAPMTVTRISVGGVSS